jgi:5'-deoxynucleotidase YfbR-like HD superfamily hydrolase
MPKTPEKPRAWQRMLSGRRLDLLEPSPLDVEIEDIAHGLARVARWNGQTHGAHAFSVAQHSVIVEQLVSEFYPAMDPKWRLAALLHDSSEYVIGDMISPFKAALGFDYKDFEARLMEAVHLRFGLPAQLPHRWSKNRSSAPTRHRPFSRQRCLQASKILKRHAFSAGPAGLSSQTVSRLQRLVPLSAEQAGEVFKTRFSQLKL